MNYQMVKGTNDSLYQLTKSSMKMKTKLDQQKSLSPSCQQRLEIKILHKNLIMIYIWDYLLFFKT
jgi:hypothetical protein